MFLLTYRVCSLLTFFVKLCVLRGLTAAIEFAFTSDSDILHAHHDGLLPVDSACTFEDFLTRWSNSWLVFETGCGSASHHTPDKANLRYSKLYSIVFTSGSHYVEITSSLSLGTSNLQRLAAGIWTAFPPVTAIPYNVLHPRCLRMWNSLPADDAKPRNIEKTPRKSDRGYFNDLGISNDWETRAMHQVTEE
jgi:hypothetical protein